MFFASRKCIFVCVMINIGIDYEDNRFECLYIFREFGRKAAEEFEQDITKWETRIAANPGLAHQEPLLKERNKLYRGLIVSKHSKLIFYVEDDVVYIAAFGTCVVNPPDYLNVSNSI